METASPRVPDGFTAECRFPRADVRFRRWIEAHNGESRRVSGSNRLRLPISVDPALYLVFLVALHRRRSSTGARNGQCSHLHPVSAQGLRPPDWRARGAACPGTAPPSSVFCRPDRRIRRYRPRSNLDSTCPGRRFGRNRMKPGTPPRETRTPANLTALDLVLFGENTLCDKPSGTDVIRSEAEQAI